MLESGTALRGLNLGLSASMWLVPVEERGLASAWGIFQHEHPLFASRELGAAQCTSVVQFQKERYEASQIQPCCLINAYKMHCD